jgi:aldose 1-epimerase
MTFPEAHQLVSLRAGRARATVDATDGARMTSLDIGGAELLGGTGPGVVAHGSFVMAPWAGRIRNGLVRIGGQEHRLPTDRTHPHAGHGLVMDQPWTVLHAGPDLLDLRCELDRRWPVPGHVRQHLRLTDTHLDQRVEVHAHGAEFPATVGWHPWFRRALGAGSVAQLRLEVAGMLARDPDGIPDGRLAAVPPGPWDDCFTGVRWPVTITWPSALTLRISSDVDFAVVYDEPDEAFCVEPQSGPPDGPNTSPTMVRRGVPLVASMRWAWG